MSMSNQFFEELEARIPVGEIRTRFAPSPTGYMHVGNLRTALYTYLIARNLGGKFILRIEDTDQERLVEGATEVIYKTMGECHLIHDEGPDIGGPTGPYIQTERKDLYGKFAELLVEKGGAYPCFCTKERLTQLHSDDPTAKYDGLCDTLTALEIEEKIAQGIPYVIRQKIPRTGTTTFQDAVFGEITVPNDTLDDNVLIKSDGLPTYNFANVIDDHLMGITHVVRGSEYLSSAPKYNLLYEAFGWTVPTYVHCSPVMRDSQHKMSKRHGDPSYEDLIGQGYLCEAVVNYVALLGWSPGGEQEIYDLQGLIEAFELKGISKSPAVFDAVKLKWMNSEYIKKLSKEDFFSLAEPYLRTVITRDSLDIHAIAQLVQSRCEVLTDLAERVDFLNDLPQYDVSMYVHKKSKTTLENSLSTLRAALPALEAIPQWNNGTVYEALVALASTLEVKNSIVLWPVRVAVSGKQSTPGGATEICEILGKEESLNRIRKGILALS